MDVEKPRVMIKTEMFNEMSKENIKNWTLKIMKTIIFVLKIKQFLAKYIDYTKESMLRLGLDSTSRFGFE